MARPRAIPSWWPFATRDGACPNWVLGEHGARRAVYQFPSSRLGGSRAMKGNWCQQQTLAFCILCPNKAGSCVLAGPDLPGAAPDPPGAELAGPAGAQHPLGPPCSLEGSRWPAAGLFLLLGKPSLRLCWEERVGRGTESSSLPPGSGFPLGATLAGRGPFPPRSPRGLGRQKPWGDAGGWLAAAWHSPGAEGSMQDPIPLASPAGSDLGAGERLSPLTWASVTPAPGQSTACSVLPAPLYMGG